MLKFRRSELVVRTEGTVVRTEFANVVGRPECPYSVTTRFQSRARYENVQVYALARVPRWRWNHRYTMEEIQTFSPGDFQIMIDEIKNLPRTAMLP